MRIKYFRIIDINTSGTGIEIFPERDNVNFFNYEYIKQLKLFPKLSKQSIDCFIRNINIIKKSTTKEECELFCQKTVKLIYLRESLCSTKSFNVPLVFSPFGEALTGDGRILISTFYVPDIKFDCIFCKKEYSLVKGMQSIEKLIMDIAEHKKVSLEEKTVLVAMQYKEISSSISVEYIRGIEFVDHYVYDQKLFDPYQGRYLSWKNLDYGLWDQVYEVIKSCSLETIYDYIKLLDTITSIKIQ